MSGFKPTVGGFKATGSFKPIGKTLQTMQAAPDPLADSVPTGDLEGDTKRELNKVEQGFRERAAQEQERFLAATETSFYCCLVFDSGAQCDAFLQATGLDKGQSDLFVDGRVLAKQMGIELPAPVIKFDRDFKVDRRLAALVRKD